MAAQQPDILFFHGAKRELYTNPLEGYWTQHGKKRPPFWSVTKNKRGYVAGWEIRDNLLCLVAISGWLLKRNILLQRKKVPLTLKRLFGKTVPIRATWYSGKLRVPDGKMILFQDSGYDCRFEKDIIITVERGQVMKLVTLDNMERVVIGTSNVNLRTISPSSSAS